MLTLFVTLGVPGLAWADGGCGSGFESWGCFLILMALLTMPALMAFGMSYPLGVFGLKRLGRRSPGIAALTSLALLPLAYVSAYLGLTLISLLGESFVGDAYIGAVVVLTLVVQTVWTVALVALGRRRRRGRSDLNARGSI